MDSDYTWGDFRRFEDYEDGAPEYTANIGGLSIAVDKDGGGTLGREYDGTWTVTVMNGSIAVLDNNELTTGTPQTHARVARLAYQFASEQI